MKHCEVIVRAFGGKPLKRVAIGHKGETVHIANPEFLADVAKGWSAPVGFPATDVFLYNSEAYDRIAGLWLAAHNVPSQEWGRLVPYHSDTEVSRETP